MMGSTRLLATLLACALIMMGGVSERSGIAEASEIKVTVNEQAVTSYDIARRSAFLRLQRRKGNISKIATEELIEDAIKRSAIQRAGYRIPESQVKSSFANFARTNNLSISQLNKILGDSGVTAKHFKEFIRLQIGWAQLVAAQPNSSSGLMSEQDVVAKMLERGGGKPTSTEYSLNQVILVVPKAKRSQQLRKRRTEANNMRSRINGCEGLIDMAKQLRDVTVRDLGRILELQLPETWAADIKGLTRGESTRPRDTSNGVEFVVVCRAQSVSDDRVARLEFSTEALKEDGGGGQGAKLLKELRKSAKITWR